MWFTWLDYGLVFPPKSWTSISAASIEMNNFKAGSYVRPPTTVASAVDSTDKVIMKHLRTRFVIVAVLR